MTDVPMTDEVLRDYERGFKAEGELRGVDACKEIKRLLAENMRLENALDEATENVRRMHEAKDD